MFSYFADGIASVRTNLTIGVVVLISIYIQFDNRPLEAKESELYQSLRSGWLDLGGSLQTAFLLTAALFVGGFIWELFLEKLLQRLQSWMTSINWKSYIEDAYWKAVKYEHYDAFAVESGRPLAVAESVYGFRDHDATVKSTVPSTTMTEELRGELKKRKKQKIDFEYRLLAAVCSLVLPLSVFARYGEDELLSIALLVLMSFALFVWHRIGGKKTDYVITLELLDSARKNLSTAEQRHKANQERLNDIQEDKKKVELEKKLEQSAETLAAAKNNHDELAAKIKLLKSKPYITS